MIITDLYSTHIALLTRIFENTGKLNNIIEFGMGNYSTELLLSNCNHLISIEMQLEEWFNNMTNKFNNKAWEPVLLLGSREFYNAELPSGIDLAFIDGHGDTRPECINYMVEKKCPIIVAHDTEEQGYGWDRVTAIDYKTIIFKEYTNWTTVWTTDINLYKALK